MKLHNLIQGSPEWKAYRAQHFNASDAPAMMGASPYKTRAELLRELHTGIAAEVDVGTQMRFDNGHRAEALARPLAEEFIGRDLYPVTGSLGKLSASFDGLTLDEDEGFEHKALNDALRAAFAQIDTIAPQHREQAGCRELPVYHRIQMEQQLLVSGARRILFMASQWTAEGELIEEQHCWYYPDHALREQILRGWEQFEKDLAAYVLPAAAEPAPVGKAPETLPALRIEVTGKVTASNLAEFKQTALAAIRAVNRDLSTDADFADAAKAVKWCQDVEQRLEAAKQHALSQTADIEALFRAIDDISAEARRVRLDLDKLVTRRKTEVKEEAVSRAVRALAEHIAALNAELSGYRLPSIPADFAGAIKGLRSFDSMQAALDTTLANAKIAADAAARGIRANFAAFDEIAGDCRFLFADLGQLLTKPGEDFRALVQGRVDQHWRAEAERKERERLRMEQEARAKVEAEVREAAERRMALVYDRARLRAGDDAAYALYFSFAGGHGQKVPLDRVDAYIAALDALEPPLPVVAPPAPAAAPIAAPAAQGMTCCEKGSPGVACPDCEWASAGYSAAMAPVRTPRDDEPATLKLGDINARLAPVKVDAAGLAEFGISPARTEGAAKLYTERQFLTLCEALMRHIDRVLQTEAA